MWSAVVTSGMNWEKRKRRVWRAGARFARALQPPPPAGQKEGNPRLASGLVAGPHLPGIEPILLKFELRKYDVERFQNFRNF